MVTDVNFLFGVDVSCVAVAGIVIILQLTMCPFYLAKGISLYVNLSNLSKASLYSLVEWLVHMPCNPEVWGSHSLSLVTPM